MMYYEHSKPKKHARPVRNILEMRFHVFRGTLDTKDLFLPLEGLEGGTTCMIFDGSKYDQKNVCGT